MGVCPRGAQVLTIAGSKYIPVSSTNTMVRPSRWAFFWFLPRFLSATAQSPLRRVGLLDVPAFGCSNPMPSTIAPCDAGDKTLQILV